jgi:hypothetical protein
VEVTDLVIIAVIVGLLEVAKRTGLPERLVPLVAVIMGIVAGIFFFSGDIKTGILFGIVCGLSAIGLFSGTKNTLGK